jgi:hypothetical protein
VASAAPRPEEHPVTLYGMPISGRVFLKCGKAYQTRLRLLTDS